MILAWRLLVSTRRHLFYSFVHVQGTTVIVGILKWCTYFFISWQIQKQGSCLQLYICVSLCVHTCIQICEGYAYYLASFHVIVHLDFTLIINNQKCLLMGSFTPTLPSLLTVLLSCGKRLAFTESMAWVMERSRKPCPLSILLYNKRGSTLKTSIDGLLWVSVNELSPKLKLKGC